MDRRHRSERMLPSDVSSTLQNLRGALHHTAQKFANSSAGGSSKGAEHQHSANTSSSTEYTTTMQNARGRHDVMHRTGHGRPRHGSTSSTEEYAMDAQHRRRKGESYEVESVSTNADERSAAKGQRHTAAFLPPPLSPRRVSSASANVSSMRSSRECEYHSTLGHRWSSAFADMEQALLTTPPVAPEEQLHRSRESRGGDAGEFGDQSTTVPEHTHSSIIPRHQHPPSRFPDGPRGASEMEAVSSNIERLELDALKRQSAELASLKIELKNSAAAHQEEVQQLKLDHLREVERQTEEFRAAKMRLLDESHSRSHIAFSAKEEIWKAEIETVHLRVKDSETALETERIRHSSTASELRTSLEQCETLRRELDHMHAEMERVNTENTTIRRERSEMQQGFQERDVELRASRHREQLLLDEKHKLQSRVAQLEESQRMQDLTARDQMRKVEKEFTETNVQFEILLNEATEKHQRYERLKAKYRTLKDAAIAKERELESALQHATILNKDLTTELDGCHEQLRDAQAALSRKEYEIRNERSSHEEALAAMQRSIDATEASYRGHLEAKGQELSDLESLVSRLQSERNDNGQRMRRLEAELDAQREAAFLLQDDLDRQKSAHESELSAALERHADGVTALKRKLAEKDRHLDNLVASQNEPAQRLRRQLEDERSKRAALEQQIETLRRFAKNAEENSRRELIKEQRRHPVYIHHTNQTQMPLLGQQGGTNPPAQSPHTHNGDTQTMSSDRGDVLPHQSSDAAQIHDRPYEPHPLPTPSASMMPEAPHSNRSGTPPSSRARQVSTPVPPVTLPQDGHSTHTTVAADMAAQHHEDVLASHQSVATEIFQRIMGGQDKFWQQCSEVMRRGSGETAIGASNRQSLRVASAVAARARNTSITHSDAPTPDNESAPHQELCNDSPSTEDEMV